VKTWEVGAKMAVLRIAKCILITKRNILVSKIDLLVSKINEVSGVNKSTQGKNR
jgi:hypothetical protein